VARQTARPAAFGAKSVWLVVGAWAVAFATLLWLANREAVQHFDDELASLARAVLAFAEHELEEIQQQGGGPIDRTDARPGDRPVYQVWKADGTLAFQSKGAPLRRLTSGAEGFADSDIDGTALRTYTTWNAARTFQVQMGIALSERGWSVLARSGVLAAVMLSALLLLTLLHRRVGARRLAQALASAGAVTERPANDLSPLPAPQQAPELAPMVHAVNGLMARLRTTMRREQVAGNDTAHALRTPLASLQLLTRQARESPDAEGRSEALDLMEAVLRRSTRLIDEMLMVARLEQDAGTRDRMASERVDLVAVAHAAVRACQRAVPEAGVLLQTRDDASAPMVRGHAGLLEVAIRNLVENAISFAAPHGNVLVEVVREDTGEWVAVRVHDSGPGVNRAVRAARAPAAEQRPVNAGLGVPLVTRIVGLHGGLAFMAVSPRLGGALAVLRFPVLREVAPTTADAA
jgi:signal transduction histidine kinase